MSSRTRWLYFIPLLAILFGLVFIEIDETAHFPWDQSNPPANIEYWFWTGGLFLIVMGILGEILALGLSQWRARAAKFSRENFLFQTNCRFLSTLVVSQFRTHTF
ncbi:MAG: hypothetical protein NVSMB38_45180 [Ktedonobacteraceae bacterium]